MLLPGPPAHRDLLEGKRSAESLWRWLSALPDANGRVHGISAGSLQPLAERGASGMKTTAAAAAAARQRR
jgi:hypothetical protein